MVSNIEDLTINYPDDAMEKVKLEKVVPFVPEDIDQLPFVIRGDEAWVKCIAVVKVPADSITLTLYLDEKPEDVTPEKIIEELKWLKENEDEE